jgi:hypothetical protein
MKRTPRTAKSDTDLTKPVKLTETEDCLGKEWTPYIAECKVCADSDLCCALFSRKKDIVVKEKEESIETYYLDMADFEGVPVASLVKIVMQKYEAGTPVEIEDLEFTVMDLATCSDALAVSEYVKRFLTLNNLHSYVTGH